MSRFLSRLASLLVAFALSVPLVVVASDHRDGPLPDQNPGADLTDVWTFLDPQHSDRVVMALGMNPFSVPALTSTYDFSTEILYQIKIDNDGDAKEDYVVQAVFSGHGATQTVTICPPRRASHDEVGAINKLHCSVNDGALTGPVGAVLGNPAGFQAFSGLRDDPFVFDFAQFGRITSAATQDVFRQVTVPVLGTLRGRTTPVGVDAIAGFNISMIVVEFPASWVRGRTSLIGTWGTTSRPEVVHAGTDHEGNPDKDPAEDRLSRHFVQLDRAGQQAIGTVFIPKPLRDAFNADVPSNDMADWGSLVPDALTLNDNDGSGNTTAGRRALLDALTFDQPPTGAPFLGASAIPNPDVNLLRKAVFPDMIRLNLDLPPGFLPLGATGLQNGRGVDEDSIDIALRLLRELADVKFPNGSGVPGSGPVGVRRALDCTVLPGCPDRRVLAVLQGTDFIGPDFQSTALLANGGNDATSTNVFPFFAPPHTAQ